MAGPSLLTMDLFETAGGTGFCRTNAFVDTLEQFGFFYAGHQTTIAVLRYLPNIHTSKELVWPNPSLSRNPRYDILMSISVQALICRGNSGQISDDRRACRIPELSRVRQCGVSCSQSCQPFWSHSGDGSARSRRAIAESRVSCLSLPERRWRVISCTRRWTVNASPSAIQRARLQEASPASESRASAPSTISSSSSCLAGDAPRGPTTRRQQYLAWLDAFGSMTEEFAYMTALGKSARAMAACLRARWPADVHTLPLYPAFRNSRWGGNLRPPIKP